MISESVTNPRGLPFSISSCSASSLMRRRFSFLGLTPRGVLFLRNAAFFVFFFGIFLLFFLFIIDVGVEFLERKPHRLLVPLRLRLLQFPKKPSSPLSPIFFRKIFFELVHVLARGNSRTKRDGV